MLLHIIIVPPTPPPPPCARNFFFFSTFADLFICAAAAVALQKKKMTSVVVYEPVHVHVGNRGSKNTKRCALVHPAIVQRVSRGGVYYYVHIHTHTLTRTHAYHIIRNFDITNDKPQKKKIQKNELYKRHRCIYYVRISLALCWYKSNLLSYDIYVCG